MKTETKEKMGLFEALRNNLYVLRLGSGISRSRVAHAFFVKLFYYFDWIFFSAYFLKYIVNALDTGAEARSIFMFILVCGAVFFCINLYRDYVENVVVPLTDAKLYHGVYLRLYRKAQHGACRPVCLPNGHHGVFKKCVYVQCDF